jgi:hypothetical protein
MVPAIILATYRNLGGAVTDEMIQTALQRGMSVAGGACGFLGACGAAQGVGIAFGILVGSNPIKARERQITQAVTARVLDKIASIEAGRCCQRDCWVALKEAASLSSSYLPRTLYADARLTCRQMDANDECILADCPVMAE